MSGIALLWDIIQNLQQGTVVPVVALLLASHAWLWLCSLANNTTDAHRHCCLPSACRLTK
jgi:hypothetical protein